MGNIDSKILTFYRGQEDIVEGKYGCQVPKGMWHTVEVIEPSVIFEAKDKAYGKDGSKIAE